MQLALTLKVTTALVAETSITVNDSPIQDSFTRTVRLNLLTYEMTPKFKPFTIKDL